MREVKRLPTCSWPDCVEYQWADMKICEFHCRTVSAWMAERARRPKPQVNGRKDVIYYLRLGELIKVGYTSNLERRLREYPPNAELLAVEPGDAETERERHQMLSEWRARKREWYHDTVEIEDHIACVLASHGPPRVIKARTSRRHVDKVHYPVTTRLANDWG